MAHPAIFLIPIRSRGQSKTEALGFAASLFPRSQKRTSQTWLSATEPHPVTVIASVAWRSRNVRLSGTSSPFMLMIKAIHVKIPH